MRIICLLVGMFFMGASPQLGNASGEMKAVSFQLSGPKGSAFNYPGDVKGKVLVVNFFASWCTTCEEEIPQLKSLSAAHPEAVYIGINVGENEKKAVRFVERNGYPWPIVIDAEKEIAKKFGVIGIPTTLVISKNGDIVFRGPRPPQTL